MADAFDAPAAVGSRIRTILCPPRRRRGHGGADLPVWCPEQAREVARPKHLEGAPIVIWCKDCPRCNGDLVSQSDIHGEFISCLQCGCILEGRTTRLETKPPHYREDIADLVRPQRQLATGVPAR